MSKARELLSNGTGPKQRTFASGVTATILPFPAGLFEDLQAKAFQDFPDPIPPKKKIKVVDGEEEIEDKENPDYKAAVQQAENGRYLMLLEAVIDLCIPLDLTPWETTIKRLEKYSSKFPDDPDERRIEFLTRYVLRGQADYLDVFTDAMAEMFLGDPEVAEKLKSFQDRVERPAASSNAPSGSPQG